MSGQSFIDLLEHGGIVMYPLLLCSIVTVAIIIERLWTITRSARGARRLHQLMQESMREQNLPDAVALCRRDASLLGPVFRAVVTAPTAEERVRVAQRKLSEASRQLKRYIWILGTVGSLAPFIGLFGTVVGIIRAFENMAATGSGGFAVVAAGISEALIATAGGLLVGVLSIFAYNAFMVRLNGIAAELREQTEDLLAWLGAPREGALPVSFSLGDGEERDDLVAEINVTPLTDIFLVLLIIFMVTSTALTQQGPQVNLPKSTGTVAAPSGIVITATADHQISIDGKTIARDQLEPVLRQALEAATERSVILRGDREVILEDAVEIMTIAKSAGAERIAIATEPGGKGGSGR